MLDFHIHDRAVLLLSGSIATARFIRLASYLLPRLGFRRRIDGTRHDRQRSLRLNLRQGMRDGLLGRQNSGSRLKIWRHDFHKKTPLSVYKGNEYPHILHDCGEQSLKHFMIISASYIVKTFGKASTPMNIGER